MPVKWIFNMEKDDCVVDVKIESHGRTITLNNHLTVNSFCKTILTAGENLSGSKPELD